MADCDMKDWPIRQQDLEPYYRKILTSLPFSGIEDNIAREFPLYLDTPPAAVRLTPSMEAMLDDFNLAAKSLTQRNILAGMARLAVGTRPTPTSPGCDGCGLCLTGCPRGAIYNSWTDIDGMIADGNIRYLSGLAVERIDEGSDSVSVTVVRLKDKSKEEMFFKRIFVGAGPINTARIVLNSLSMINIPVKMLESQKFILPLLRFKGNPSVFDENGVTLPNGLIILKAEKQSDHWSQVQLSPVNDGL